MEETSWEITAQRFVAFFDIMGFKDLVQRNSHKHVLNKITIIKKALQELEVIKNPILVNNYSIEPYQTHSITFSDSIVVFSKGNDLKDLIKILVDSSVILHGAISRGIAIKGGLSYGEITADFENSLFFGQAIIDAYLLHEELQMYSVIIDHSFSSKLKSFPQDKIIQRNIVDYKANLKTGKVTHALIRPAREMLQSHIKDVEKLYQTVSGHPRIYVDNTLEFLRSLLHSDQESISTHPTP